METIKQSNYWRNFFVMLFTELFKFLVFLFLIFYLFENIWAGFVSNYFPLSYLLFGALVSLVIVLLAKKEVSIKERFGGWWLVFSWAVIFSALVAVKAQNIGSWRYLLGLTVFVVFVVSYKAVVNLQMSGDEEFE